MKLGFLVYGVNNKFRDLLFLSDFHEMNFLCRLKKSSNIKFHENPSSGSRVYPFRRTDRRTDRVKLIVACGNFAKAL